MTKTAHERVERDRGEGKEERRPGRTSDKGDVGVVCEHDKR